MNSFQTRDFSLFKMFLKCQLGMITLVVIIVLLSLDQSAIAQTRQWACNDFNPQNRSFLCMCSHKRVMCFGLVRPLNAVPIIGVKTIEELDLNNNAIATVNEKDFLGLEHLTKLLLQNNSIEYIHQNAFRNMFRLSELNLNLNNLGRFDPTGFMFQHLLSLRMIFLEGSRITEIHNTTFLTQIAANSSLQIYLGNNPIKCDCNVLAYRIWLDSHSPNNVQVKNLICTYNGTRIPYTELEIPRKVAHTLEELENESFNETMVTNGGESGKKEESSMFGQCSVTNHLVAEVNECFLCTDQRTNHGCKQKMHKCDFGQVCTKTFLWNSTPKRMGITSSCGTYKACLLKEANNNRTCGLDYSENNVECTFCNLIPSQNNEDGRTQDYTFIMTFTKLKVSDFEQLAVKGSSIFSQIGYQIDNELRNIYTFRGGIDSYLLQFNPERNRDQVYVQVRLDVTTLNTITQTQVIDSLGKDLVRASGTNFSYFNKEKVKSIKISPIDKQDQGGYIERCFDDVSKNRDKGNIIWKSHFLGHYSEPCPFQPLLGAYRTCLGNATGGSAFWSMADYTACPSKDDVETIFYVQLSLENAYYVSAMLKNVTENLHNMTVPMLSDTIELLEKFANATLLGVPGVVTNVVGCLNNFMKIDKKTLIKLEQMIPLSKRLLEVISFISEKGPLFEGKLVEVTPNLAIVAQEVNAGETRDIVLSTSSSVGQKFSGSMVSVEVENSEVEKVLQESRQSSIVIPMHDIINSLNSSEKMHNIVNISRVSFAVHLSDILFSVMRNVSSDTELANIAGKSQENSTQVYQCEENRNPDCPTQNVSLVVTKVNSLVISASVPGIVVQNLTENVTMRFVHVDIVDNNTRNPRCVFWDQNLVNGKGDWSGDGCSIIESNLYETTCACNHLTNFALLMDVYQGGSSLSAQDRKILSIISYLGCGISLLALILTILTYTLLRKIEMSRYSDTKKMRKLRRDKPSMILINLCVALLLSNLIFLVGMHDYTFDNVVSCKVVAVLMHYFLLASLTWMAVEAFYMYLALILVFKTYFTHFILKCSLVGWGVPFVIVVFTLGINTTDNYEFLNSGLCWLRSPAFYAAFVGPVCLILLINCLAFGLVIRQLWTMSNGKLNKTDRSSTIQRLRGLVGVVVLLGLTWLFAIFAIDQANTVFYYFFAVFNSLQGLFIFIFYCLLKKDVVLTWKRSLFCFEEYGQTSKAASTSKAMTTKAAALHLVNKSDSRSRTDSSSYLANTTSSTLVDSCKSSFGMNMNIPNPEDSCEECDPTINTEIFPATEKKEKLSPLLLQQRELESAFSDTEELPSNRDHKYALSFKRKLSNNSNNDNQSYNHNSSVAESQLTDKQKITLSDRILLPDNNSTMSSLSESNNSKTQLHSTHEDSTHQLLKTEKEIDSLNPPVVSFV